MRNISKTIAALSLLAPASAHSIGIGDIKLHSALNEKLNAEIALNLDAGENVDDIRVKLAPIEKFDKSGIPWSHFLNKIKFEPIVKNNRLVVVKLTTNEAVTEPFLDFLVEVSSVDGSQYREFTVLIDPPSHYAQPLAPVTALPAITAKQSRVSSWTTSERPARERVSRPERREVAAAAIEQPGAVRVRRNDTLSKIAARVNSYADVSEQQMAIALFQANPQAFYRNNINALSAGSYLNVPDKQAILRISRQQAGAEYRRQNQAWQGGVEIESGLPAQLAEDAKLTLAAPAESEVGQEAKVAPAPETPARAAAGEKPAAAPSGQTAPETAQVQERIRLLEEKLAEMEKRLAVKDAQLFDLQRGAAPKPEVTPPQPEGVAPPAPAVPAPPPEVPAQPAAPVPPPTPAVVPPPQPEPAQPAAPVPPPTPAVPPPQPEPSQPAAPVPPTPAVPAPQPVAPPAPVAQTPAVQPPAEETPLLSYGILGGIGVALLGMFGWLYMRKRQIELEQSRESMFASSSQISLPSTDDELLVPNVIDDSPNFGASSSASTSSFLNDFGSEFTFFDTEQNEVDPVSEADVYLAYGRYQQAEELMRNAIAEQPERDEFKLKLLEIFLTNSNKKAFEDYVKKLADDGKKNDAKFWSRVTEMAGELIPESPLFSNVKQPESALIEKPAERPERKEVTAPNQEKSAGNAAKAAGISQVADFSIPEEDFEQPNIQSQAATDETESTSPQENTALDFDFSPSQATASEEPGVSKEDHAKDEFESLDFNLKADVAKLDDVDAMDLSGDTEILDNLESFDFFTGSGKPAADSSIEAEAEKLQEFGKDDEFEKYNFEPPVIEAAPAVEKSEFLSLEDSDQSASEDFGSLDFGADLDLTGMDELETKIDLAKAYIDMGDAEAAREIAEDVLARGNPEQKREAQAIIDGL